MSYLKYALLGAVLGIPVTAALDGYRVYTGSYCTTVVTIAELFHAKPCSAYTYEPQDLGSRYYDLGGGYQGREYGWRPAANSSADKDAHLGDSDTYDMGYDTSWGGVEK